MISANAGHAQTAANISVVQGNGQMICDGCPMTGLPFFDPLIVKVTDANGNPVPNAQVTWAVVSTTATFAGSLASATTVTGSTSSSSAVDCNFYNSGAPQKTGETCNVFSEGSAASPQVGYIATTIQALIPNGQSVTFTLTQSPNLVSGTSNLSYITAQITFDSPLQVGATVSGSVGMTLSTPIKVLVRTLGNTFISGVSVRLIPEAANQGGAAITCQTPAGSKGEPGSVLTGSDGAALCYPMFTAPGSSPMNFDILVGGVPALVNPNSVNSFNQGLGQPAGTFQFGPFRATATPNNPAFLQVFSGNNQSANAGAMLAQPLIVQVLDSNRNPLPGNTVNWVVTPSNAATVNPQSGTSDSNGQVSTSVTLTSAATGNVQVAAQSGSLSQSFSITVTVPTPPLSSLTIVSGNNQSVPQGMVFGTPLAVMATLASGAAASGVPVQFAITGGSGSLSASGGSATQSVVVPTGSNGQASVTATAGSSPGTLTVVASVSGFSQTQTFNLTVLPPAPPINTNSFLNGAGFFATQGTGYTALSPCGVATLAVGSPLAPSAYPVTPNMYTTPLQQTGNTSVSFQLGSGTTTPTVNAPILNIGTATTSQQLITFQVPCELTPSNYNVTVSISGGTPITVQGVAVRPGAPGIFETLGSDGMRRAIAVRPDGSIVSLSNPARRGENIRFYITGAGPVLPALASSSLPTPGVDSIPTDPNQVVVGLNNAGVGGGVMVRAATELIGVYEVTFQVPNDPSLVGNNNVLAVGVAAQGNPTQYQQPGGSKLAIQ
jgi:uncharacterized protein (TIGR03437 family)